MHRLPRQRPRSQPRLLVNRAWPVSFSAEPHLAIHAPRLELATARAGSVWYRNGKKGNNAMFLFRNGCRTLRIYKLSHSEQDRGRRRARDIMSGRAADHGGGCAGRSVPVTTL
jgi:hypothetical protein